MSVGKAINHACASTGKTKAGLAKYMKVTPQTVSNWSQVKTEPTFGQLALIAAYFGMRTGDFVELGAEDNE